MQRKSPPSTNKAIAFWLLGLVAVYDIFLRCLHLLRHDHYYLISPDSYFFHWQAQRVLSGETVPLTWHSGLTYPLAYAARFIAFAFDIPRTDALDVAARWVSPALGVCSLVVMYLAASKMFGRRIGLLTAFVWAITFMVCFIEAAGSIDRDALSLLLLMTGAFVFYLSRSWHVRVGHWDLGWLMGGLMILGIEALLFDEWVWLGPVLLVVVLASGFAAEFFTRYLWHTLRSWLTGGDAWAMARRSLQAVGTALKESNWRPFALVLCLSVVIAAVKPGFPYMYRTGMELVSSALGSSNATGEVQELQGMGLGDIVGFGLLLIPLLAGFYAAVKRHSQADLFCLGWFVGLFALGLFSRRVFAFALPAASLLSAVGLGIILDFRVRRRFVRHIRIGAAITLMLLLVFFSLQAMYVGQHPRIAVHKNWQDALAYLKGAAPEDAVVMTWWDYGYWILDLANLRPVVDNGFYYWDEGRLRDIGLAYCATNAVEAEESMRKYGAEYLIFSRQDIEILPSITRYGLGEAYGDRKTIPDEMNDSLYTRALNEDFQSEDGLSVCYRNEDVVILAATPFAST